MINSETRSPRRFILASLFLHAALLAWVVILSRRQPARDRQVQWTRIELEPPRLPPSSFRNRIVQSRPGERTREASRNSYLGERTQIVDRQTVSRSRSVTSGSEASSPRAAGSSGGERRESQASSHPAQPAHSMPPLPRLAGLGLAVLPDSREQARRNALYEKDEPRWASQAGDHTPGNDSPQDYIAGVAESDQTALNTREYRFFGYYERIRAKLDGAWISVLRRKLGKFFAAGRHLANDMDHTTRVLVVLNPKGEVIRVQVVSQSGTMDLDDAAVEAFNDAGPFPNPPKGLVDGNGEIQVPWEFVIHS